MVLSVTINDDDGIEITAINGFTSPMTTNGTATAFYGNARPKFCNPRRSYLRDGYGLQQRRTPFPLEGEVRRRQSRRVI